MNKPRRLPRRSMRLKVADLETGAWQTWEIEIKPEDTKLLKSILRRTRLIFPSRSETLEKYLEIQARGRKLGITL